MDKLYLIVRGDLPLGLQAAQLCHAMRQWVADCPKEDRAWYEKSNTVVLLTLPNEGAIGVIVEQARALRIPTACFREPDLNNEVTAIALGPRGKRLTNHLSLWPSVSSLQSLSSSVSPRSSS